MAQHFLLSSEARSFSLVKIARMTERQAESFFRKIRWKCKDCYSQFSITSGTLFANHKLPLRTYLMAIALFVNEVKGIIENHTSILCITFCIILNLFYF